MIILLSTINVSNLNCYLSNLHLANKIPFSDGPCGQISANRICIFSTEVKSFHNVEI